MKYNRRSIRGRSSVRSFSAVRNADLSSQHVCILHLKKKDILFSEMSNDLRVFNGLALMPDEKRPSHTTQLPTVNRRKL